MSRRARLQEATCFSSGGTENAKGLIRHNQTPPSANGEMQQRKGSSCTFFKKVAEHDNLKLAAAKAGVRLSLITAVNYLNQ